MSGAPKVSVITISYNQEQYIKAALDSFVMQETKFPFEVIVADDGSTDNTQKIIKQYAAKYPDIFRPILREKNVGAQNNCIDALQQAKGEYIALCEGDDYWTDPTKLQQQVELMDANPDYALCFHPVRVFFENKEEPDQIYPEERAAKKYDLQALLEKNFIQTNSVMYRRQSYDNLPNDVLPLDWYLHLYHAQFGKIGFIDQVMSAYRRHAGGVWWQSYNDRVAFWRKRGEAHLAFYERILPLYAKTRKNRDAMYMSANYVIGGVLEAQKDHSLAAIEKLVKQFPVTMAYYLDTQHSQLAAKDKLTEKHIANLTSLAEERQKELVRVHDELRQALEARERLEQRLEAIYSSKWWKLAAGARRTAGKAKRTLHRSK